MLRGTRCVQRGMGNLFQGKGVKEESTGEGGRGARSIPYFLGLLAGGTWIVADMSGKSDGAQNASNNSARLIGKSLGKGNYVVLNEGCIPQEVCYVAIMQDDFFPPLNNTFFNLTFLQEGTVNAGAVDVMQITALQQREEEARLEKEMEERWRPPASFRKQLEERAKDGA